MYKLSLSYKTEHSPPWHFKNFYTNVKFLIRFRQKCNFTKKCQNRTLRIVFQRSIYSILNSYFNVHHYRILLHLLSLFVYLVFCLFTCYLAALSWGLPHSPNVNHCLYSSEPCYEVRSLSPAECLVDLNQEPSDTYSFLIHKSLQHSWPLLEKRAVPKPK